jgi:hypothetical protein
MTKGVGFDNEHLSDLCFAKQTANYFNAEYRNLGRGGASNLFIFKQSLECLLNTNSDILVVQWASLARHWLHPAPECELYLGPHQFGDFSTTGRELVVSKSQLKKFNDMFLVLNHNYQNFIDLVNYCNQLEKIASMVGKKIVYINGSVPWPGEFFETYQGQNLETYLGSYSKTLLDFVNRSDQETVKYLNKLTDKCCSLNRGLWVNLLDSLQSTKIDLANDNMHPGAKSNKILSETLINHIIKL